jgi:peptide/nickel transport system ATP-binding protein
MLKVKNLNSSYFIKSDKWFHKNQIKAVEDINLEIPNEKTFGLVGESGCGKSSLGRSILRLQKIDSGSVIFQNKDILTFSKKELFPFRKKMQIIFQDPFSSLNPRWTISEILSEGLDLHESLSKTEKQNRMEYILTKMNLKTEILDRYPHEFSGGQRQRISIARSLILEPEFLVCDEIVSALDVSNQAQVLNLLTEYKKEKNLSMLFISHDLNVISYISDFIGVMYLGRLVEVGRAEEITSKMSHPYTKLLYSSLFELKPKKPKKKEIIKSEIPSIVNKPKGCYFHTRCPMATDLCREKIPEFKKLSPTHSSACHYSS